MRVRRVLALSLGSALLLAILALAGVRLLAPPEVRWRSAILATKLRGDLPGIPIHDLARWLLPGSPVYLANLAQTPNPHAAIGNPLAGPDAAKQGQDLYVKH